MPNKITMLSAPRVINSKVDFLLVCANAFFKIKSLILLAPIISVLNNYNKFPNFSNIGYNPATTIVAENFSFNLLAYTIAALVILTSLEKSTSFAIKFRKEKNKKQDKGLSLIKEIDSKDIEPQLINRITDFVRSDKFSDAFKSNNLLFETYTGSLTSTCDGAALNIISGTRENNTNNLIDRINYHYEMTPESIYYADTEVFYFINNNHIFDAKRTGSIKDVRISQILFLGYLVSAIKSPEIFFSEESAEQIEMVKNISQETITELMTDISRHLLATSYNMEIRGDIQGQFAVCYAYDQMNSSNGISDLSKYKQSPEINKSKGTEISLSGRKDSGATPLQQLEGTTPHI